MQCCVALLVLLIHIYLIAQRQVFHNLGVTLDHSHVQCRLTCVQILFIQPILEKSLHTFHSMPVILQIGCSMMGYKRGVE
ncbi:hypothetical protein D3C80_1636600 [compost metagenome]